MRVLFVHQQLGALGGAESTIRRLGEGLTARGFELGILYGELAGRGHDPFFQIFPKRWCWSHGQLHEALGFSADVLFVHKLDDLDVLSTLTETDKRLVRMVHDHDIYCQRRHRYLPLSRRICTRRAGWACGVSCGIVRSRRGFPLNVAWPGHKLREIELCKRFDHHITVSDFLKDELILHGFDESKLTTLWPAVRDADPSFSATYREPLLVYAGQILRGKGVDVLIDALGLLRTPGWRALIVGDGSLLQHCRELVAARGLEDRVELSGWVPQEQLDGAFRNARVGVVPSVWPEPLGAVGIEMLRHALPVVAFDVGGIGEWLKDGENGYLVKVFDRAALAERIDRLLGNPELARRLGTQGRLLAETWCNEERYFDGVARLLSRSEHPPESVSSSRAKSPEPV